MGRFLARGGRGLLPLVHTGFWPLENEHGVSYVFTWNSQPPGVSHSCAPNLHFQKDEGWSPENGATLLVPTGEGTNSRTSVATRLWAPPPLCVSGELADAFFPLL